MDAINKFLPFILIFAIFYFFMILPQQKRIKKEKSFVNNLKKGDNVVTKSGMHGRVLELNDKNQTCVLETMAGKIKFETSAISMEMSQKLNTAPSA